MKEQKKEQIEGFVEEIIYRNDSNDYSVILVALSEDEYTVAVGDIPNVAVGEGLVLSGTWTYHSDYGRQFAFDDYRIFLPQDEASMYKYLSSGVIKGLGPATAKKIILRYSSDSFDVIENHPDWLCDISGISPKKAAKISESFIEQKEMRGLMMLCDGKLGTASIGKICGKLGPGAVGLIKKNPYMLCDEDFGIGFDRADSIAMSFGIERNDEYRLASGLSYVLNTSSALSGHTCLPREELITYAEQKLEVGRETIVDAIDSMTEKGELVSYFFEDTEYVFTRKYASSEEYISSKLLALDKLCPAFDYSDIESFIIKIEYTLGISYAKMQRKAIAEALRSGVTVITGGPGTGKTTIIKALISIFSSMGMDVALAAPTGRAAKRMSEATGEEAKTVHRMLEMEKNDFGKIRFGRDEKHTLDEKVVIIDEASMIDTSLTEALLRAIRGGTRIIFIGDADQLPPVGSGNVLNDIIKSERFNTVRLCEVFRQSQDSLIVTNAHRVNGGEMPILDSTDGDFFHVLRSYDDTIAPTISSLILERLPKTYGQDIVNKIQVITPSRKGKAGTEALNAILREQINPASKQKSELSVKGNVFREGDRVMQVKNNYDIEWDKGGYHGCGVFNGDIGTIESIDAHTHTAIINFDDRIAKYEYECLEEIEHAYAITVHKSQGSEYPVVIIPLYSCAPMLMTRNLIYTAITRAKKMVITVGRKEIMKQMVDNDKHATRYTMLSDRLTREA